jgi:heme oxygenase
LLIYLFSATNKYRALELALDNNASHPVVQLIHFPRELSRKETLEKDLAFLRSLLPGSENEDDVEECTCKSVQDFVKRVEYLGQYEPHLLPAYSYIRYLGDLSGGQFLSKKIKKMYQLPAHSDEGIEFYTFNSITDIGHFKQVFKNGLDQVPEKYHEAIVKETYQAFVSHGLIFQDIEKDIVAVDGGDLAMGQSAAAKVQKCVLTSGAPWLTESLKAHGIGHAQLAISLVFMGLAIYVA